MASKFVIGIVGNPNCGKTTLFNALTGAKQRVGNWPGVTVERKTGRYVYERADFELVDLPGTYSLDVAEEGVSLDEQIARDYVAERTADLIINTVDGSNLERNLYLTSQLLEMDVPLIVVVNMMDVAKKNDIEIDIVRLSEKLGCPVLPVVASSGQGVEELRAEILESVKRRRTTLKEIHYGDAIENAIATLLPHMESTAKEKSIPARWLALRLLEGDSLARRLAPEGTIVQSLGLRKETEKSLGDDIDICIADHRYGYVNDLTTATMRRKSRLKYSTSDKIDRIVLNRALGIPVFLVAMYLMFMFTINLGGAFIDFFDMAAGAVFVNALGGVITDLGAPRWLVLLLADGIGGGIQVVATFVPVIAFLYLFLSALEDSGYMARAAFVMDRAMCSIGLPGKAFVPLIVGFGCNVPAIMATRSLEQQRDRIMTIIMTPFMSCGARLPVYALFAAAFFPDSGQNVVFSLYLIGIVIAVITGYIMKNTLLPGQTTPFVMELPAYHIPTLKSMLLQTSERTRSFLFRAGKLIVPMVLVLNVLNAIGPDGSYGDKKSGQSVLSAIGRTIAPAFSPMGLEADNWPAAVGIVTGVLAKEAVVGTLDSLYDDMADQEPTTPERAVSEPNFSVWVSISEAFATIPNNLYYNLGGRPDPMELDTDTAAEERPITNGTYGAMQTHFNGRVGAFAYLLFILLYFPCVAALAAIYKETNFGWTLFVASWTTGLAYAVATIYYQAVTFNIHPTSSALWIMAMIFIFIATFLGLRHWGRQQSAIQEGFQSA